MRASKGARLTFSLFLLKSHFLFWPHQANILSGYLTNPWSGPLPCFPLVPQMALIQLQWPWIHKVQSCCCWTHDWQRVWAGWFFCSRGKATNGMARNHLMSNRDNWANLAVGQGIHYCFIVSKGWRESGIKDEMLWLQDLLSVYVWLKNAGSKPLDWYVCRYVCVKIAIFFFKKGTHWTGDARKC